MCKDRQRRAENSYGAGRVSVETAGAADAKADRVTTAGRAIAAEDLVSEGCRDRVVVNATVIDADVHPRIPVDVFVDYMPEPWKSRYYKAYRHEVETFSPVYPPLVHAVRLDALPPGGAMAGSVPEFADRQIFVDQGVDYAILIPLDSGYRVYNAEFDSATFSAINACMADTWLGENNWHGRYFGSVRVAPLDPAGAAREIEKWADHPKVVQIFIAPEQPLPFGNPAYDPIWEAAQRYDLPVGVHIHETMGAWWLTPVGFTSYLLAQHTNWSILAMTHIASLILEGVFERFPRLRFAWIEAGFDWLAPLMWRLDNQWRELKAEVPSVKRASSEYIMDHMRFTTQPVNEVGPFADELRAIELMQGDQLLMYASDYPHYDYDAPQWLAARLPDHWRGRVMGGNAREFYGLPSTRSRDLLDG